MTNGLWYAPITIPPLVPWTKIMPQLMVHAMASPNILALSHIQLSNHRNLHILKNKQWRMQLHAFRTLASVTCWVGFLAGLRKRNKPLGLTSHELLFLPFPDRCSAWSRTVTSRRIKKVPSPRIRTINNCYLQVPAMSLSPLLPVHQLLSNSLSCDTPSPICCL